MTQYLPPYGSAHSDKPTITATAAVTGGRLVTIDGLHAAADSVTWLGPASKDAAIGEEFIAFVGAPINKLVASAAITKGARVKCAAAGKLVTFVDGTDVHTREVGVALQAALADGDEILVAMAR